MGITVNKNGIPNDPRSFVETSGIRIGTAPKQLEVDQQVGFVMLQKEL